MPLFQWPPVTTCVLERSKQMLGTLLRIEVGCFLGFAQNQECGGHFAELKTQGRSGHMYLEKGSFCRKLIIGNTRFWSLLKFRTISFICILIIQQGKIYIDQAVHLAAMAPLQYCWTPLVALLVVVQPSFDRNLGLFPCSLVGDRI